MERICPIYKGKGSKSNPENYRPISVLSVVARLFEKLIHDQLLKHLDKYLYSHQSGFRPRHSTETSLLNTTNQLFLNIDRGQYNTAVFIDLRKAFDTVSHNILLCKLWHYGIRGTELRCTGLYAAGFSISEIETSLNKDLSRLCLWLHANKLSINAVKSKFMLIASPHIQSSGS